MLTSVQVSNLWKLYRGLPVLRDVTFSLSLKHPTAILGKRGAGKSTLLKLLSGLVAPSSGKVYLNGHDYSGRCRKTRPQIAYCSSNVVLDGELSVAENLIYCGVRSGLPFRSAKEQAFSLLDSLKMSDYSNLHPEQLSPLNKRKVALVRALAASPKLLLLDEPTHGLPSKENGEYWQTVAGLAPKLPPLVFATESPAEANSYAASVLKLCLGSVEGTPYHSRLPQAAVYKSVTDMAFRAGQFSA